MKRKVIKQGHNTLTITLPKKWVQKYKVNPGSELEVTETDRGLLIALKSEANIEKIQLDIKNLNDTFTKWLLHMAHKSGFDEVRLFFDDPSKMSLIHNTINLGLLGYEIIEQSNKSCLIKNISLNLETEFDSILNRIFLVTISMAKSGLENLKTEKFHQLKEFDALESTNNKLTNFCERILNKNHPFNSKKQHFLYVIIWQLEKIADEYKYLFHHISKQKPKINKSFLEVFSQTNSILEEYYSAFYKNDIKLFSDLIENKEELSEKIDEMIKKGNQDLAIPLSYLKNICSKISEIVGSTFMLNIISD